MNIKSTANVHCLLCFQNNIIHPFDFKLWASTVPCIYTRFSFKKYPLPGIMEKEAIYCHFIFCYFTLLQTMLKHYPLHWALKDVTPLKLEMGTRPWRTGKSSTKCFKNVFQFQRYFFYKLREGIEWARVIQYYYFKRWNTKTFSRIEMKKYVLLFLFYLALIVKKKW